MYPLKIKLAKNNAKITNINTKDIVFFGYFFCTFAYFCGSHFWQSDSIKDFGWIIINFGVTNKSTSLKYKKS